MNKQEFELLSEELKQSALLAIALGMDFTGAVAGQTTFWRIVSKDKVEWLHHWNPSDNKALMWGLVCELGHSPRAAIGTKGSLFCCEYYNKEYKVLTQTDSYNTREQALIAAYIAADPKGNIVKWRNENESRIN